MRTIQHILFALFALVSMSIHASTPATQCKKLIGGEPGDENYVQNAEKAYRDCRGADIPADMLLSVYRRYADTREALGERQAAISIYKNGIGEFEARKMRGTDALLIEALDQLARLESRERRRADAVEHATRALNLRRSVFGLESREVAVGLSRLGMVFVDARDFIGAEPYLKKAIEIATEACAPQCEELSEAFSAMSVWYSDQGNETEAKRYWVLSTDALPAVARRKNDGGTR